MKLKHPNKLQQYRKQAELSQLALATALGQKATGWKCNPMKISFYERESDPSIYVANCIVVILNDYIKCTFEEVFPFSKQKRWVRGK